MEQCELCYRTPDEPLAMLCDECKDKAARFDIELHNKNMLLQTITKGLEEMEHALNEDTSEAMTTSLISGAMARLRVAKKIYGEDSDLLEIKKDMK